MFDTCKWGYQQRSMIAQKISFQDGSEALENFGEQNLISRQWELRTKWSVVRANAHESSCLLDADIRITHLRGLPLCIYIFAYCAVQERWA